MRARRCDFNARSQPCTRHGWDRPSDEERRGVALHAETRGWKRVRRVALPGLCGVTPRGCWSLLFFFSQVVAVLTVTGCSEVPRYGSGGGGPCEQAVCGVDAAASSPS